MQRRRRRHAKSRIVIRIARSVVAALLRVVIRDSNALSQGLYRAHANAIDGRT